MLFAEYGFDHNAVVWSLQSPTAQCLKAGSSGGGFAFCVDNSVLYAPMLRLGIDVADINFHLNMDFVLLLIAIVCSSAALLAVYGFDTCDFKFKPREFQPSEECSICMEPFSTGAVAQVEKCRHIYHEDCIKRWSAVRWNCPVCRGFLYEVVSLTNGSPIHSQWNLKGIAVLALSLSCLLTYLDR
jgi:hypothetical protein